MRTSFELEDSGFIHRYWDLSFSPHPFGRSILSDQHDRRVPKADEENMAWRMFGFSEAFFALKTSVGIHANRNSIPFRHSWL